MTVLDQSAATGRQGAKAMRAECRCLNCGAAMTRGVRRRDFCGRPCVRDFNNRRMRRGAEIYDLLMVARFERDKATRHKVWRAINRLASNFREEDRTERDGRRSWRRLADVMAAKIFLWAE